VWEAEQSSGSGDGARLRSFFPPFAFFNPGNGTFPLRYLPCQVSLPSLLLLLCISVKTSKISDTVSFAGLLVEAQSRKKFSNLSGTIAFPLL